MNYLQGGRPDVPHVMLVVTDGISMDDVNSPAKFAKKNGIKMLVVGISDAADYHQLYDIANHDERAIFLGQGVDSLQAIQYSLQQHIKRAVSVKCISRPTGKMNIFQKETYILYSYCF